MKKTIIIYGLLMAAFIFILKFIEYRFLIRDLSTEVYVGIIAGLCTVIGVWMGLKFTKPKVIVESKSLATFALDQKKFIETGLSEREYDVLKLMAVGLSNKEIADKLFVSMNTVKTHAGNLFVKLNAKRRTQAVQEARNLGILP